MVTVRLVEAAERVKLTWPNGCGINMRSSIESHDQKAPVYQSRITRVREYDLSVEFWLADP